MNRKSKTILLVEDQIVAAAPALKVLTKAGYDIVYVMRGEDAVQIVEAGVHLDLIVMDIDLGKGMCGLTASEKINLISEIPVLFFTGHTENDIKERISWFLPENYLSKKNTFPSLIHSIEKLLFSV